MEFIGYYYCDVILLKVITTAIIKGSDEPSDRGL